VCVWVWVWMRMCEYMCVYARVSVYPHVCVCVSMEEDVMRVPVRVTVRVVRVVQCVHILEQYS
jgi:hypothetical protein